MKCGVMTQLALTVQLERLAEQERRRNKGKRCRNLADGTRVCPVKGLVRV